MRSTLKRISPQLRSILILFLVTRIGLTLVGVAAREILPPSSGSGFAIHPSSHSTLDAWAAYDSWWYLRIAERGYGNAAPNPGSADAFAFPPLYPLAIRTVHAVVPSTTLSALFVSNVALLVSALLLYHLVRSRWNESTAGRCVLLLFLFPLSFYFSAVLSESLFLAFMLGCLLAAEKNRWWLAGMLGGLAALTRVVGLVLVVPLAILYWQAHRRVQINVLGLLLFPLAYIPFLHYAARITGSYLAPLTAHSVSGRDLRLLSPLAVIVSGLGSRFMYPKLWSLWALTALATTAASIRRIGWPYAVLTALLLLVPLSTGIYSVVRYSAVAFPLLIVLALTIRPRALPWILGIFAVLQIVLMATWSAAANPIAT